MARRSGSADLPLHGGRVPRWLGERINRYMFPGMFGGGGSMALNQLLVKMDGIDEPPFMRKFWTNRINNFLDATYVVPRKIGSASLRLAAPKRWQLG